MKRFEARHPANMLVTLGDNDYLESPSQFRANWQNGVRLGASVGPAGRRSAREPRLRARAGRLRAEDARHARALLHPQARRRPALLPRLERDHDPADEVARAAALGVDGDLEDRALPPSAVHVRRARRETPTSCAAGCRSSRATASSSSSRGTTTTTSASRLGTASRTSSTEAARLRSIGCAAVRAPIRRGCGAFVRARLPVRLCDRARLDVSAVDMRGRVRDHFTLTP